MKSEEIKRYYANGKLLISGEYLVLSGAEALAVPLKMGQRLTVEKKNNNESPLINWQATVLDKEWFSATIRIPELKIEDSSDAFICSRLLNIFKEMYEMNKGLFESGMSYDFSTDSTFGHNWGMGSSSALIANLARFGGVDPFELSHRLNKGSGYDVATALADGPIIYSTINHRAKVVPVKFHPEFHSNIWFVYTGQKQDTEPAVEEYYKLVSPSRQQIETMNYFTGELYRTKHLNQFMHIINEHECFISRLLGKKTVKEVLFNDFDGEIKSLGAWGGDILMAVSELSGEYIRTYFQTKGLQQIFDYESLILS